MTPYFLRRLYRRYDNLRGGLRRFIKMVNK